LGHSLYILVTLLAVFLESRLMPSVQRKGEEKDACQMAKAFFSFQDSTIV